MTLNKITIAVDAMGGENSPYKVLKGVEIFLKNNQNVDIVLLGDEEVISNDIKKRSIKISNFNIINTTKNVSDDDDAKTILRNREDSSIYRGLEIVKKNKFSGFVSAGNTGALMILSRLQLGMIEGIDRPAICSIIPCKNDFSIMLDLGANVSVTPRSMLQFAIMGYCYHSILNPSKDPKIGIINIGTENNKGLEFLQESHDLINKSFLSKNFYGFLEPNHITSGICDIILSDGYTGNIILKTAEGMSQFITDNLKTVFYKKFLNKIAYKILEKDFKIFKDQINPEKYNGATFIGVDGISVKSHGSASPYAFSCAIDSCYNFIKNDINLRIKSEIKKNQL